jgi:hypothetical protein
VNLKCDAKLDQKPAAWQVRIQSHLENLGTETLAEK